jgi:hypothetical protein
MEFDIPTPLAALSPQLRGAPRPAKSAASADDRRSARREALFARCAARVAESRAALLHARRHGGPGNAALEQIIADEFAEDARRRGAASGAGDRMDDGDEAVGAGAGGGGGGGAGGGAGAGAGSVGSGAGSSGAGARRARSAAATETDSEDELTSEERADLLSRLEQSLVAAMSGMGAELWEEVCERDEEATERDVREFERGHF